MIEEALRASPLLAAGGWHVTTLLSPRARVALAEEAARRHATAAEAVRLERSPDEDTVRGNPARFLEWAPGGPRLHALYHARPVAALLRRLTGLGWAPTGGQAAYSYYRRPGHFLDVHRDIETCDLALITCLHDTGAPGSGLAGALCLWPRRGGERLAAIRAAPDAGRVAVRLRPGESIVLLGGLVPHRLEPVAASQARVVAPLCFRAQSSRGAT